MASQHLLIGAADSLGALGISFALRKEKTTFCEKLSLLSPYGKEG